jgi:uncharacterized protein YlaN (UPF0358 family)
MDTDFYKHHGIMTPKLILLKLTVESTLIPNMLCLKLEINFTIKLFLSEKILGKNAIRNLKFLYKNCTITKVNQCLSFT